MDIFTEALSVVPILHLPMAPGQRVLLIGDGAKAAVETVLRYPTTSSVIIVAPPFPVNDKRVQFAQRIEQVAPDWKADLVLIAVPALADSLVAAVRAHHLAETGVVVFALARPNQAKLALDLLKKHWAIIQPYREHVPGQVDPAWFLMAGDHGFQRHRIMPTWTQRLSDKYLPSLFTFAKDERALVLRS
jgi:spermidine synthase